eukprot:7388165-Prymnesium_polylepis.1
MFGGEGQKVTTEVATVFYPCPGEQACLEDPGGSACDCIGGSYTNVKTGNATTATAVYNPYMCQVGHAQGSDLCAVCDTKYSYINSKCKSCPNIGKGTFLFIAAVVVLCWFPLLRQLNTNLAKSMYTTVSYLQYLGFYSVMRIQWGSIGGLFEGLFFFNLSLESIMFGCADISPQK